MKRNIDGLEPTTTEQNSEKNTEKQQSQTYVLSKEDKSQYGEIIEVEPIEGTPFNIITLEDGKGDVKIQECFIAIGNQRITEMTTYVKCLEQIQQREWGLISSLIAIVTKAVIKEEKAEELKILKQIMQEEREKTEGNHNLLKAMNGREDGDAKL